MSSLSFKRKTNFLPTYLMWKNWKQNNISIHFSKKNMSKEVGTVFNVQVFFIFGLVSDTENLKSPYTESVSGIYFD